MLFGNNLKLITVLIKKCLYLPAIFPKISVYSTIIEDARVSSIPRIFSPYFSKSYVMFITLLQDLFYNLAVTI